VVVKGVEQSAIQHCLETAPQTLKLERVSRGERNLDPTFFGLVSGHRQCGLSHVNAQNLQSQLGDVKSVFAGATARIEDRSGESALGCHTHDCRLRPSNIPGRRAVVIRRIPRLSRHPFVTGWASATQRTVSKAS
jgi:hypothetical protein